MFIPPHHFLRKCLTPITPIVGVNKIWLEMEKLKVFQITQNGEKIGQQCFGKFYPPPHQSGYPKYLAKDGKNKSVPN